MFFFKYKINCFCLQFAKKWQNLFITWHNEKLTEPYKVYIIFIYVHGGRDQVTIHLKCQFIADGKERTGGNVTSCLRCDAVGIPSLL